MTCCSYLSSVSQKCPIWPKLPLSTNVHRWQLAAFGLGGGKYLQVSPPSVTPGGTSSLSHLYLSLFGGLVLVGKEEILALIRLKSTKVACFLWYWVWLSCRLRLDHHFMSSEQRHDCWCSLWRPRSVLTNFPQKTRLLSFAVPALVCKAIPAVNVFGKATWTKHNK